MKQLKKKGKTEHLSKHVLGTKVSCLLTTHRQEKKGLESVFLFSFLHIFQECYCNHRLSRTNMQETYTTRVPSQVSEQPWLQSAWCVLHRWHWYDNASSFLTDWACRISGRQSIGAITDRLGAAVLVRVVSKVTAQSQQRGISFIVHTKQLAVGCSPCGGFECSFLA